MCPQVKVILLCFDLDILQNGLMGSFHPLVSKALRQSIKICVAGPGWKHFFFLNNNLGVQGDGLEKTL